MHGVVLLSGFRERQGGSPCASRLPALIERVRSLRAERLTFVAPGRDAEGEDLLAWQSLAAEGQIVVPDFTPPGPAGALLLAVDGIDPEAPLAAIDGQTLIDADLGAVVERFRRGGLDGGALAVRGRRRGSCYLRSDANGLLLESSTRCPADGLCLTGLAYFARGAEFVQAAMLALRENDEELSLGAVFNRMILWQARIGVRRIPRRAIVSLDSPRGRRAASVSETPGEAG